MGDLNFLQWCVNINIYRMRKHILNKHFSDERSLSWNLFGQERHSVLHKFQLHQHYSPTGKCLLLLTSPVLLAISTLPFIKIQSDCIKSNQGSKIIDVISKVESDLSPGQQNILYKSYLHLCSGFKQSLKWLCAYAAEGGTCCACLATGRHGLISDILFFWYR